MPISVLLATPYPILRPRRCVTDVSLGGHAVLGLLLALPRTLVAAGQNLADEYLVQDMKLAPAMLVGYEGMVGCLLCVVVAPVVVAAGAEDVLSSCRSVLASPTVAALAATFVVLVSASNYYNVLLVQQTSAVTKEVWRSLRPTLLWLFSLLLFYIGQVSGSCREGRCF